MRFRRRFEVVVEGESGSAISQRSVISEHRTEREAREAAGLERRRLEVIRAEEAASWVITVLRGEEVLHQERPFEGRRDAVPVSPLGAARRRPAPEDEAPAAVPSAQATDADPPESGDRTAAGRPAGPEEPADAGSTGTMPAVGAPTDEPGAAEPGDTAGTGAPARDAEAGGEDARPIAPTVEEIFGPEDTPLPDFLRTGRPAAKQAPDRGEAPDGDDDAPTAGDTGRARRPTGRDLGPTPSGRVPDDVIRRFEASIERERERRRGPGGDRD